MTSQINPFNIDGTYPIAGQDNNSQGFRTNFTNTQTNFEYAAQEITDLQNNVLLKAALNGTTLNNNMNGSLLFNAQTQQMTQTVVPLGTVTTTATLNFVAAPYFTLTTGGSISLSFSNLPASGVLATWAVAITIASTSHTVTFPASVTQNARGIQGFNTSTNVMAFAATGTYTFAFSTSNGGTTVTITELNKELQPFNNSMESLTTGSAANVALTTSYFTTSGTATLADGVTGQIKVLAQTVAASMVVTVANAGWKATGSGTITLGSIGTGCTLQFIDGDWMCIGNNGCTFG
jgi:hypothetical protein